MDTTTSQRCEHDPVWLGRVAVAACADCARIDWLSSDGPIDPAEAMAAVFGSYDLIGPLDALGAPARRVLAYAPPSARKRRSLDSIPPNVWLKAAPHLWLAHDTRTLLLAPTRQVMFDNITRGA